jgi:anti-sigma B factor antagonist
MGQVPSRSAGRARGEFRSAAGETRFGGMSVHDSRHQFPKEAIVDLQMSARTGRACTVVEVRGEIDSHTTPMLEDLLQEVIDAGARHVVLDLTGVTFMDSSGLSLLVVSLKRLRDTGGHFCLAHVQGPVRNVLLLSAMDTVLDVYETVEAAEDNMPPVAA